MKLFEQGRIGTMTFRNRVAMTPMGVYGLPEPDGALSERSIAFYSERALGGAGMVMPAAALVSTEFEETFGALNVLDSREKAEIWGRLAGEIHRHGARLGAQLSIGLGRVSASFFTTPGFLPVSASRVPSYWNPAASCRPLSADDIRSLVSAFGRAAGLASESGVDFVEIHGYGGYLLDQFMSSLWNKREDGYGGDLSGRMRLALELVKAARSECGESFPIVFKFTPLHGVEGGRQLEEGLEIARILEDAGVDALHVDVGCYESWHLSIPPVYSPSVCQADVAREVKGTVGIPVITHGKLGRPEDAESVLEDGKADFVGLGRPLLADPHWAEKVREGRSREIMPCIGCSEGCMARGLAGERASCAVNPLCARESEFKVEPAAVKLSVMVAGGGPAGMTAASLAAARGHRVVLLERSAELGGQLIAASAPEFKSDVARYLEYLRGDLERSDVEVRLSIEDARGEVLAERPDAVVVATGGRPAVPDIPGIEGEDVMTAANVLTGDVETGERVVVAGGGVVGCETALFLESAGREVVLLEEGAILSSEPVFPLNFMKLSAMIDESTIQVHTGTKLLAVQPAGVVVERAGEKAEIECDSVVLALGTEPVSVPELEAAAMSVGARLLVAGEAAGSSKVLGAVWDGFDAGRVL